MRHASDRNITFELTKLIQCESFLTSFLSKCACFFLGIFYCGFCGRSNQLQFMCIFMDLVLFSSPFYSPGVLFSDFSVVVEMIVKTVI